MSTQPLTLHHAQRPGTRVPRFEAPDRLDTVLALLADHGAAARPVAGGTDLVLELDRGGHPDVEVLVDLHRIEGLDDLVVGDDGALRLGPLVTHAQVVASAEVRRLALPLAQACLEIGSPQIRNRATVVGNLVTASPANDTISALLALDASVELTATTGTRVVALADFFTGFRSTVRRPDELVTAVLVPPPGPDRRGLFVKLGLRRAQAISVVHLAVVVEREPDGLVTAARLALGSVAATVVMVPGAADALVGARLDDATIRAAASAAVAAATPIDDLRATAEYRTDVVATMVERALRALAEGREADTWPTVSPCLTTRPPTESVEVATSGSPPAVAIGAADAIEVRVNGRPVRAGDAAGRTLLDWLRESASTPDQPLTGTKEGCAEGECGACTVLLDGQAVMSCLVPAGQAAGAEVTTVEGLAGAEVTTVEGLAGADLDPVQQAFIDHAAVQCGYCIPGFLVAARALLAEVPDPDEATVSLGLSGNLCRCTGYYTIQDAVRDAAGRLAAGGAR